MAILLARFALRSRVLKKRVGGEGPVKAWGGISVRGKAELAILIKPQNSKKIPNNEKLFIAFSE